MECPHTKIAKKYPKYPPNRKRKGALCAVRGAEEERGDLLVLLAVLRLLSSAARQQRAYPQQIPAGKWLLAGGGANCAGPN